jgi:nitroreductase
VNVLELDAAALRAVAEAPAGEAPDASGAARAAALHPQFRSRWSPRALAGTPLAEQEVLTLLEAARWAPSCFNAQPWRFAWVLRGAAGWDALFAALIEGNRTWAARAGALIAIASRSTFEQNGQPHPTHAFDAGAAWMSLALQARHQGLVAHGMRGFDVTAARTALALPEGYDLWAIVAVGHPGHREDLPEAYQARETPSPRLPLDAIAFAGGFHALSGTS